MNPGLWKTKPIKTECVACGGRGWSRRKEWESNPARMFKLKCKSCKGKGYIEGEEVLEEEN